MNNNIVKAVLLLELLQDVGFITINCVDNIEEILTEACNYIEKEL